MNNTISHTICMDTNDLKDMVQIEKKLMEISRKACRKMLVENHGKKNPYVLSTIYASSIKLTAK
ncbi:hypothetical protein ES705_01354 [subsurface metagenome]|nr:hypothetical protein [Clostridia bacterium]